MILNDSLDLHHKIEYLQSKLQASTSLSSRLECELIESRQQFEKERSKHQEELAKSRDRYERLIASHQRLSKLNHDLEGKLLDTVERIEREKLVMTEEINELTERLRRCEMETNEMRAERDRYKDDCAIAAKLLQANPENFLGDRQRNLTPKSTSWLIGSATHCSGTSGGSKEQSTNSTIFTLPTYLPTFPPVAIPTQQQLSSAQMPKSTNAPDMPQNLGGKSTDFDWSAEFDSPTIPAESTALSTSSKPVVVHL